MPSAPPTDRESIAPLIEDIDNPPGGLTKYDRAYLLGDPRSDVERTSEGESYTQAERNKRAEIRSRIRSSFTDFARIFLLLSDDDREQILPAPGEPESNDVYAGMVFALAFLYERLEATDGYDFEHALTQAVAYVKKREGGVIVDDSVKERVSVEIDDSGVLYLGPAGKTLTNEGVEALSEDELDALLFAARRALEEDDLSDKETEAWLSLFAIVHNERGTTPEKIE